MVPAVVIVLMDTSVEIVSFTTFYKIHPVSVDIF